MKNSVQFTTRSSALRAKRDFIACVALAVCSLSMLLAAEGNPQPGSASGSNTQACQPFFRGPVYWPGTSPSSIAIGDFNGDGVLDLVSAGWFTDKLYVLLGKKDGTFVKGQSFSTVARLPRKLVVGDFNNDTKLDVAIADDAGAVYILLGNGDGTFQPAIRTETGSETDYLAVGDFNHDGNLDIAAVGYFVANVQVLLGKGDGTFQKAVNYSTGQPYGAFSVAVADFNGDGHLDIAVTDTGTQEGPGQSVSVFLGKGDGTFHAPNAFGVGHMPTSIMAVDLNGDGKIDLATSNQVDGTASVLINKGNGEFRPAVSYPAGHPFAPYGIAAGVFDKGSAPSLVVSGAAGLYVLVNKGDGTFAPAQGYNPPSIPDPVIADFNGDGKGDLAVGIGTDGEQSGIAVLFGRGHGVFASSTAYPELPALSAVGAGDFRGQGKLDLAVGDTFNNLVGISFGDGKGHYQEPNLLYSVSYPVSIATGIFRKGNKKVDMAVLSWPHWTAQIFLGNGDGSFNEGQTIPITANWPAWITLADFNNDGILDLGVTSSGDYESQGAVSIILGKGDGTFGTPLTYGSGNYVRGAVFGDFNADGKLDFVLPRYDDKDFLVFLGNGDGTFRAGKDYSLGAGALSAVAGDFNRDGNLDLVISLNTGANQLWLGNGNGTFRKGPVFAGGGVLAAADMNGDGKLDLVTENSLTLIQVELGRGDGTFQPGNATFFGGGGGLGNTFALADLLGNGGLDLALPGYNAGAVSVLLNRCRQ